MFWRLAGLVVSVAVCGMWVLSLRHNRVQAQSELTQAQLRVNRQDERLWVLRSRIAGKVTPPEIERLCLDAEVGPLHAILPYSPAKERALALVPVGGGPVAIVVGPDGKLIVPAGEADGKGAAKAGSAKPATAKPGDKPAAGKPTPANAKAKPKTDSKKPPAKLGAGKPTVKPQVRPPARVAAKTTPRG